MLSGPRKGRGGPQGVSLMAGALCFVALCRCALSHAPHLAPVGKQLIFDLQLSALPSKPQIYNAIS